MSNYYEVLGVSKEASESEIKSAYRTLSLQHHPDRPGGDTEKFKEINVAYETLSDESKRNQYNDELNGVRHGGMHFGHPGDMNDMQNIFNMMFGGGFPGGGMPGFPGGMPAGFGGPNIRVFHNGVPMHHQMQKPPPIIKNIKITLEQSFTGVSLPIEIDRWVVRDNNKMNERMNININIPPGLDESECMVLRDAGNAVNDALKGDIKIVIQIENTTSFVRSGLDLTYKKTITLKEALCGFSFEIIHLNGKQLMLNNKNSNRTIIKPNYKKVIPGMGMQRDGNRGNLIIDFDIEFPDSLTTEQIDSLDTIM